MFILQIKWNIYVYIYIYTNSDMIMKLWNFDSQSKSSALINLNTFYINIFLSIAPIIINFVKAYKIQSYFFSNRLS